MAAPGVVHPYRVGVGAVLALAAFNLLFRLHDSRINVWDEARHGVIAHEMLESGQWLVTTYAGAPDYWFLKPPLGIWLIAASYQALGYSLLALRLPSALCALAGVALVMAKTRSWFGRGVSLLAGLILATCFPYVIQHGGRTGDLDAPLALVMLLAMACLPGLCRQGRYALGFGVTVALGFLLKSFAVIQIVVAAAVYLVLSSDFRRLRPARWLLVVGAGLAPILLWAIARYHADGTAFLAQMLREDLLLRPRETIGAPRPHPLYYLGFLLDRMAPWTEVTLGAVVWLVISAWQRRDLGLLRAPGPVLLLMVWALVPLVLFSLARTQHHWYINATLPAVAVLSALAADVFVRSGAAAVRFGVVVLMVGGLAFGEWRIVEHVLTKGAVPEQQRFLRSLGDLGRGTALRMTRPPDQTERFILQVLDGFRLEAPDSPDTRRSLVLIAQPAGPSSGSVLRESLGYRLVAVERR